MKNIFLTSPPGPSGEQKLSEIKTKITDKSDGTCCGAFGWVLNDGLLFSCIQWLCCSTLGNDFLCLCESPNCCKDGQVKCQETFRETVS